MIKKIFFFFVCAGFFSCKSPLPIYFNKPIGKPVAGFDSIMFGNYFPMDVATEKSTNELKEKFEIEGAKISFKKPKEKEEEKVPEVKDTSHTENADTSQKDIDFPEEKKNPILDLNNFYPLIIFKPNFDDSKTAFGYLNFSKDKITAVIIDSSGTTHTYNFIALDEKTKLTKYKNNYYLNFKSDFGWEIAQLEKWHDDFISVNLLYITSYDESSNNEKEFLNSVKRLYPRLKIIKNKEGKIIGVKAKMKPKKVLLLFERKDEALKAELYKIN